MRGDLRASCCGRRSFLRPLLGLVLAPLLFGIARAEDEVEKADAARLPPQPGDHFVFLSGPNKGQVVRLDNLAVGGPQVQVFPAGPDGTIRNGTPLNLVILARFDPADFSEETRARAAEGVVAYSAVCTHQACPVNMWSKARDGFVCSCHGSVYTPSLSQLTPEQQQTAVVLDRQRAMLEVKRRRQKQGLRETLPFSTHLMFIIQQDR